MYGRLRCFFGLRKLAFALARLVRRHFAAFLSLVILDVNFPQSDPGRACKLLLRALPFNVNVQLGGPRAFVHSQCFCFSRESAVANGAQM